MRVLVVGCGLGGLATALGLTKEKDNGIEVVMVEHKKDFASRGATFGLAKNGQAALEEIAPNVLTKLKDVGFYNEKTGGYVLPWWVVRDTLLEKVKERNDRITIHLGVSIETVVLPTKEETDRDDANGANNPMMIAKFAGSSDLTIEADVIVGADGLHSCVRQKILDLPPANPTNTFGWRGSINTNASDSLKQFQDLPLVTYVKFGRAIMLNYFNFEGKVDGKLAWTVSYRRGISADLLPFKAGETSVLDLIESYVASVDSPDEDLLRNLEDAKLVFEHTHKPSELVSAFEISVVDLSGGWGGRGNVTLIGDAAHSIRPASGLGGSLAFEDAALLSRALTQHKKKGESSGSIESCLRSFEAKRLPRCQSISRDQSTMAEIAYKMTNLAEFPQWDPVYRHWVFQGPDATPEPPVCELNVYSDWLEGTECN